MNIVIIPKKLAQKDDLIVIPRTEYEALLRKRPKFISLVKLTPSEKRAVARSEREFSRGEYVTLKELEYELGGTRVKKH